MGNQYGSDTSKTEGHQVIRKVIKSSRYQHFFWNTCVTVIINLGVPVFVLDFCIGVLGTDFVTTIANLGRPRVGVPIFY